MDLERSRPKAPGGLREKDCVGLGGTGGGPANLEMKTLAINTIGGPITQQKDQLNHAKHGGAAFGRPAKLTIIFYLLVKNGWRINW